MRHASDSVEDRPIDAPSLPAMELARLQSRSDDSLRARLLATAGRLVGAGERDDFLKRVAMARGYRLSPDACAALTHALSKDPEGLEQNADLIRLPSEGLWVEFAEADRNLPFSNDPEGGRRRPLNVGVLIAPDPEDDDRFAIMAAWDFEPRFGVRPDALVRHGYGVVVFSMAALAEHSFLSRTGSLDTAKPALVRLLDLAIGYVPDGFHEEATVTSGIDPLDEASNQRLVASFLHDVAGEVPLALSVALLLSSRSFTVTDRERDLPELGVVDGIRHRLSGYLLGKGFRRSGSTRSPGVRFAPTQRVKARPPL